MSINETPGDEPQRVWLCASPQDRERAEALARTLNRAGFAARGSWSLDPGDVRADKVARELREARWVVVLGSAELMTEEGWPEQAALLRTRPRVVVVPLRRSVLLLEGATVLEPDDAGWEAQVLQHLQGRAAPAWASYGQWLRRRYGQVPLWRLRESGAHEAREEALETLYVLPVLRPAEVSAKRAQPADAPAGAAQPADAPAEAAQPAATHLAPEDLLQRQARCLLIRGEPGLGKSTLLRYLALRALAQPDVMPVWLSAARVPRDGDLVAHLKSELASQNEQYRWLLGDALARGELLLLIDGLDEVASEARQALVRTLQTLREQHPRVRALLTTRPAGTVNVPSAECIDLQRFEPVQSKALWERLGTVTAQERPAFWDEWRGWSRQVQALAEVPLLLSLLRQVATGKQPLRGRVEIYQAVLWLFLDRWAGLRSDQSQPQRSIAALEQRLSWVALRMHGTMKEALPEAAFRRRLTDAHPGVADIQRLLSEALDLGLLKREGDEHLAFQHATFREYLASQALLRDKAEWQRHLPVLRGDPRWREVLYLAVAQRGILEEDEADAERRLREVLDGPTTCVSDVLLQPLCLVAELLNEGVGAPQALAMEVLRRLRESLWLEIPEVDDVLKKLSANPELPWEEAWLEAKPRVRSSGDDPLARIIAWLAPTSERARGLCQRRLTETKASNDHPASELSLELAAFGLARGGDRSVPVLKALAGWQPLEDEKQPLGATYQRYGLVARLTNETLAEAARRPKTAAAWARGLLDELRRQLASDDLQSRLGAAWLLAEAGVQAEALVSHLWEGSRSGALSPPVRERARALLAAVMKEWPAAFDAFLVQWRGMPAGTDEVMDSLTAQLLQRAGAHRAEVIERLLDSVEGGDEAQGAWAKKYLVQGYLGAHDAQINQALWSRIDRPSERSPSARWRLFGLVRAGAQEQWVAALHAFLAPDCPIAIRYHAAIRVADSQLSELDGLALHGLVVGLAVEDSDDVSFWLGRILERSPTLRDSFAQIVEDCFTQLPLGSRFQAASYLYRRRRMSHEAWLEVGVRDLEKQEGGRRLWLIEKLANQADPEVLSLALLPLLGGNKPDLYPIMAVLRKLQPSSAAVLHGFLTKLASTPAAREEFAPDFREVLPQLAAMLWRNLDLLDVTLEWLHEEALRPLVRSLLSHAVHGSDPEHSDGRKQLRERLLVRLGHLPPQLAWVILQLTSSWGADPRVKEALLRSFAAEELAAARFQAAYHLQREFHEEAPLRSLLQAQCRSADPGQQFEAALGLQRAGLLGPEEHGLLAELLHPTAKPELLLAVAGLLLEAGADAQLHERITRALAACLDQHEHVPLVVFGGSYSLWCPRRPQQLAGGRMSSIADWAAALLFSLPSAHELLSETLLSWLHPNAGVTWTECAGVLLRALRPPAARSELPIVARIAARPGLECMQFFGLGLALGVPAARLLPALLAAMLRSPDKSWAYYRHPDGSDWHSRLEAQLGLLAWWWHRDADLESLLRTLHAHEGAAEELLAALGPALSQVHPVGDASRTAIALTRVLQGGATAEDHDQFMVNCLDSQWQVIALAVSQDRQLQQRLAEAAIDSCREASKRLRLLDHLCAAERMTPSSARAEILRVCSAWLAEEDPMVRLLALETIGEFGRIEPIHLQSLLALLDGPTSTGWCYAEGDFRRHCAELILRHFPESASAVHGPLLAVLRQPGDSEPERTVPLLMQAACPRAPLLAGIRAALAQYGYYELNQLRSTLVEHGLFAELAADFTDVLLGRLYSFTSTELADSLSEGEPIMEVDPRTYTDWSGKPVEVKRFKHIPTLLAGALARRLGVSEDAVQDLWTAVGRRDDTCAATFHRVVQQATADPVLRPFARALVERWGTQQTARI